MFRGDVAWLSARQLERPAAPVPTTVLTRGRVDAIAVVDLLLRVGGVASSKRARGS